MRDPRVTKLLYDDELAQEWREELAAITPGDILKFWSLAFLPAIAIPAAVIIRLLTGREI